jgi:hypothetical protein
MVAGLATALAGGGGLAVVATDEAVAVSVESLSVDDAQFQAEQVDPVVDVTIGWEYAVERAEQVIIELLVGETVVAEESLRTSTAELSNESELSGRVVRSEAWSASDFAVERGETVTRDVTVGVRLAVRADESVVAEDTATDTATVEVAYPEDAASASIGGEGMIRRADE